MYLLQEIRVEVFKTVTGSLPWTLQPERWEARLVSKLYVKCLEFQSQQFIEKCVGGKCTEKKNYSGEFSVG